MAGGDKPADRDGAPDAGLLGDEDMVLAAALEGATASAATATTPPAGQGPALAIGDLLADGNNEVVLFGDGDVQALTLTGGQVVGQGTVEAHVTETGADVSGYHFVTFDGGLTLYYQDGLNLVFGGDEAA
ncbi:MAG: hypothetical protein RIM84_22890 [Alphaproteobacteria bacterium]